MSRVLSMTAAVFAAMLLLGGVGAAQAATYSFTHLHGGGESEDSKTGGEYGDYGSDGTTTASDQLSLDVSASGKDAVSFTFYNYVGEKSSITDIYVAGTEGLLVVPGKITEQSAGVNFSIGADPENLPGGKPYDFFATAGADSNPPVEKNGINASKEYVTWTFALASGVSYDDVISAIDSGQLRIGLRAPGLSGGSSSFMNSCGIKSCSGSPTINSASVPLPASIWLLFGAMGGLTFLSRFRRRGGRGGLSAISAAG